MIKQKKLIVMGLVMFSFFFATMLGGDYVYGQGQDPDKEFISCVKIPTKDNFVNITAPSEGQRIGDRIIVQGKSDIKTQGKIWVLAHLKLLGGKWWPQDKTVVDKDGNWQALAWIGQPQDIGMEFEIAVATFDENASKEIERYHLEGQRTGNYLPIGFPKTNSNICIITVTKER